MPRSLDRITQRPGLGPGLANLLRKDPERAEQPALNQILGGRYQLKEIIGRGGFSTVYQALDLELDHPVAVKVARAGGTQRNDDTRGRCNGLRDEALTAMRLSHPLIVRVYDYGRQSPWEYLVMEVVGGTNLHALLQSRHGGRLRPEETILIGLDVLEALSFAHRKGITHNDITPKNILLDEHGDVKVCDFGASIRLKSAAHRALDNVAGTILFASPERMSGLPTDARSDLYSLGATLYTACSGQAPFDLQTIALRTKNNLHTKTIREKVRRSPHVPPLLHAILEKALELDPTRRYVDAHEMRAALVGLLAANRATESCYIAKGAGVGDSINHLQGRQQVPRLAAEFDERSKYEARNQSLQTDQVSAGSFTAAALNPRLLAQRGFDREPHMQDFPHRLDTIEDHFGGVALVRPPQHRNLLERCGELLKRTLEASPDVEGIALVSQNKLIMRALSPDLSDRRVMEIASMLMNLESTVASNSAEAHITEVTVRWDRGYAMAIGIESGTRLLVLSNEQAKLGILLYNLRNAIDEIKHILKGLRSCPVG